MMAIRVEAAEAPFDEPRIARRAAHVLTQAEAMGLLEGLVVRRLDERSFGRVLERIAGAGVGKRNEAIWVARGGRLLPEELAGLVTDLAEDLEMSPLPQHEWPSLERILGTAALARLLDLSPVSVRRYRSRARQTPDAVASRLHFIASLVGDLAGAYNEFGIRRWFERPRAALDGRAPAELLSGEWSPDDQAARMVRELARSLSASPAT